ncbi:MAG: glycoside hydrolase family 9 protein [Candidatus Brocadiia bacterium]
MPEDDWTLTDRQTLEAPGISVFAFHNFYPSGKQAGIEIVHHGERVATCGELRPDPWSGRPPGYSEMHERRTDPTTGRIEVDAYQEALGTDYTVRLEPDGPVLALTVDLAEPLDPEQAPHAAFCMQFYPPAYFGRTYALDGSSGMLSRVPLHPVTLSESGVVRATDMGTGAELTLAPEGPLRRLTIEAVGGEVHLFDPRKGDDEAWFNVATEIPPGATRGAVHWLITPNRVASWRRDPVICVSQVGYHPDQDKRAVIELDSRCDELGSGRLLRIEPEEGEVEVFTAPLDPWGAFLRYTYGVFDFTEVTEPGLYVVRYGNQQAGPFRIGREVYRDGVWQPTLDAFFPIQMCHVEVWDGLRLWHGKCHLDDALQAPCSREHHDHYRSGPTTDTCYEPFEHIPGLNVGGWHDAGDTDLAAGSQAQTVLALALAREEFGIDRDQTAVRREERVVEMYHPDGEPDILQQIAWGVECLLGGYRASGHSYCGIVAGNERHFYQRGEQSTMTDNLVYDPDLEPGERTGERSGDRDDRWAFTNRDTSLEYLVCTALAAASRVLTGFMDELAEECLRTAEQAWEYEQEHERARHRSGYVPGNPDAQEVLCTAELLLTTGRNRYRERLLALRPVVESSIGRVGWSVARALPRIGDDAFAEAVETALEEFAENLTEALARNPFAVLWSYDEESPVGGQIGHLWGIGWSLQQLALRQYYLVQAFPDLFARENVLSVLNYVLGCHPDNNLSLVSGVGARFVDTAFGLNRSSWSYVPGGVVSGPALIRPDLPELKSDIPFIWQQSEYVMSGAATYIFCVLAADRLLNG